MPEQIFIDGAIDPGRERPDGAAGGAGPRATRSRISATTPRFPSPATAASASCRSRAGAGWRSPATCRSTEGLRVLTDSDARARASQGHAAAHAAESPGGLRHLRQGRRMHAAGLPLQVQRRAVGIDRSEGPRDQVPRRCRSASCSTTSAASSARAACASRARSSKSHALGIQNRGDALARSRGRGPIVRRRPVFRQRHRYLPGGRAPVARVPLQVACLVPASRRRRSARAAPAAAR